MTRAWILLAGIALVAACGNKPTGQEWLVVETDADTSSPDVTAPDVGMDTGTSASPDLPVQPQLLGDSSPCTDGAECSGGSCLTGDRYPNGFCTTEECVTAGCAEGSECRENRRDGTSYCAPMCGSDYDCGEGLACRFSFGGMGKVCLPIRGAADGEDCAQDFDCQGFACLSDLSGNYCTSGCNTSDDCATQRVFDNVCLVTGGVVDNYCVRACDSAADCRDRQICLDTGDGVKVCLTDPVRPIDDSVFEPSALNIQCGIPVENGLAQISYDVADTTTSYMVTPMARDGQPIVARRIIRPDGSEMNFNAERWFLGYPAVALGSMNPTLVPAAPSFADMLAPGTNQFALEAEGTELCYYLLEKQAPGNTLDLNVYLLGVPGVTAATAGSDPNFLIIFDEMTRIYAQIGVQIGTVRFYDPDVDTVTKYSIVRTEGDLNDIVKTSKAPAADLDSMLSVDVFFAAQFAFPGGVIGSTTSLPGPAGLHGTHASGLVFTAEWVGGTVPQQGGPSLDGNLYTALILAHEVGHFLGLHHTTQTDLATFDPLDDTARCVNDGTIQSYEDCPDVTNLMFPIAIEGTELSPDQGFVVKGNPVIRTVEPVVTP